MNIVKIKEGFAKNYAQYNDKYCYFINWHWIVPFDCITQEEYIEISQQNDINCLGREIPYIDYVSDNGNFSTDFSIDFANREAIEAIIDKHITFEINSISKYIEFNKFSATDNNLTFEQVRKFRTWLAEKLLNIVDFTNVENSILVKQMLNYYKDEKTDDVVKGLYITTNNVYIQSTQYSSCGCNNPKNLDVLHSNIVMCNPIEEYRKSIYDIMVSTFSNIDFWTNREDELLIEINKYLDYIIKKNLPLYQSDYSSDLYDCDCLSNKNSQQERYIGILKNLYKSFEYIINKEVINHKNFIGQTLNDWSIYIYERMRW